MIWCSISIRLPAMSKGFGLLSVSGRMRSPRPAARIIALNRMADLAENAAC
jgi:hypothetical protein